MTRKLGEILVAGNFLTPEKLKKALDAQMIFGGRLGTNLLELGLLDEMTLMAALREQSRIDVAKAEDFEAASKEALSLIPPKVAARHVVVPLALHGKKLRVAMMDPSDLIAVDELAFITGCTIIPLVAPEVRLRAYLEKYYEVARPIRYITLSKTGVQEGPQRLDDAALAAQFERGALDLEKGGATPTPGARPPERPLKAEDVSPEGETVLTISELLGVEPGEAVTPQALAAAGDAPAEDRERVDAVLEQLKQRREAEVREAAEAEGPIESVEEAAGLLADADTREDIGDALIRFARSQFPRVMTWIVQKDRALGWLAHVPGVDAERARQAARRIHLPLGEPSVLSGVTISGQYYMGELPARPGDEAVAAALGSPRPRNLVILPVKLSEKVTILVMGDGLDQPLTSLDMKSLRTVCQKASLAMEVLLIRSKIRRIG